MKINYYSKESEFSVRNSTNQLVKMALLAALSIFLVIYVHFPIFPAAPYLEYDPADVPILIGAFMFGPIAGLIITIVVALIQAITVSASSGWVGFVMHVLASGTLAVVAGLIYKKYHTFKGGVIALIAGSIAMTLMMIPSNLFFTVKFWGVPIEAVKNMLIPIIIPFNLIKAGASSIVTVLLYKRIANYLRRSKSTVTY